MASLLLLSSAASSGGHVTRFVDSHRAAEPLLRRCVTPSLLRTITRRFSLCVHRSPPVLVSGLPRSGLTEGDNKAVRPALTSRPVNET